jgi:hypothetical protein
MAIIKKYSPFQNLSKFQTFLVDENPNSDYFGITELKDTFTGGKNGFLIEGSPFLKETTEVKIEILDVEGNPIYFEPGDGSPEYYEGLSKLVSVHVYDDTPIGIGKITILGELKEYVNGNGSVVPIPSDWAGVYNVKWEKSFKINKNISNEDIVRFYKRPIVQIDELVKPIFTKTVQTTTDNVEVTGIPQQPIGGTDLSSWRAGTLYKLIRASGSWDVDVDENIITVSLDNGGTYSPTIIEVLNDKEVLVDVPYTENNLVSSFVSQSSSITYQDFAGETISESALTGSFAKIDLYQLKTFVGDVARVKVFRKSRNEVGDFQFVQESRLESTELLRDITTSQNTEISYGRFSEDNLSTYWTASSIDHPITVDSSVLSQAIKVDYNGSGVQKLETIDSFTLSKDVEYELAFRTLLSGSTESDKYVKAYFSGSYTNNLGNPASYIQTFMHVSGSDIYKTRQNVSQNILAERDIDAKLVFEFKGDDWYVSNVSLRNAQETSFSPDEFTLIQDIPRKLPAETFDFRFEFYDINNNYIPVDVKASKEFTGGNDFPTSGKLLTFESDRNAFRYSSGSANPENQQIKFSVTSQNLTGSVLYDWNAFDISGSYITENGWGSYPGELTNPNNAGALLTVSNFEGTWTGSGDKPEVYSITYTASREDLEEFETVYRLEDGDNAPTLLVTSNANQFIYEPTTLSPKPSGQSITIRAQRKNLASLSTPITVNKSNPNGPNLTEVSDANGIKTYSISATQFSSSFADNNFDEITYSFTGSDVFGDEQYDEITISKVVNFDGVSVVLSTENTSFESDSTGTVTSTEFNKGDGTVDVRIGSNVISHSEGLGTKNTFDIVSVTPSTGLTVNLPDPPTTNSYGISAMSVDSGTLTLLIRYKAGDNSTTVDFTKVVNYSKAKKAQPSITFSATPQAQTVDAYSNGTITGTIQPVTISGFEGNTTLTYNQTATLGLSQYKITDVTDVTVSDTAPNTSTLDITTFSGDTATGTASIAYKDSEGTTGTSTIKFTLSKAKKAPPSVLTKTSPTTQTINSSSLGYEIPQQVEVVVQEGGSEYIYDGTGTAASSFKINSLGYTAGSASFQDEIITLFTGSGAFNGLIGSASIDYIDSEGTAYTNKLVRFDLSVSKIGRDGDPGPSGSNGTNAFSIELNPPSQEVIVDVTGSITTPDTFAVQVFDGEGSYSYSSTIATNGTFKVTNLSQTNHSGTPLNSSGTITPVVPDDVNGSDITFDVTVKDRGGNTSSPISKTHKIRVVADGTTGPGIVFTGVWDTNRIYQYDLVNGRRDVVLWSRNGSSPYDTYYATLQQAGASIQSPDITTGSYWEELGQQDFFVAAKIGLFEESYVQNTLNIGTNSTTTLAAANITLWGKDDYPYFSLGQSAETGSQEFGVNGIFIGRHDATKNSDASNGAYVMSLSNGTNWMKWNGTTLNIKGALTFTNQGDTDLSGFGGFTALSGSAYDAYQEAILASGSAYDADLAASAANQLANDALGDLQDVVNGDYVGGTFIDENIIYAPNIAGEFGYIEGAFGVGNINGGNGIVLNGLGAATSNFDAGPSIYIGQGNYNNADTPFYVSNAGGVPKFSLGNKLTFDENGDLRVSGSIEASELIGGTVTGTQFIGATGEFSGNITATTGNIGGWGIVTNQIYSPTTGAKIMELTAGTTPSISINDSNGDMVVDINSSENLTGLGAGTVTNPTNVTLNGASPDIQKGPIYGFTFNTPVFADGSVLNGYWGPNTSNSRSFNLAAAGNYTVTTTIGAVGERLLRFYGNSNTSVFTANMFFDADIGFAIVTDNSSIAAAKASYVGVISAPFQDSGLVPMDGTYREYMIGLQTITTTISLNAGTYYLFPVMYNLRYGYQPNNPPNGSFVYLYFQPYTPDITSTDFSVSVNKTEINGGGLQVVSGPNHYVLMERDTSASGIQTMLEVGGSIEATGNITANASDARLKDIKSKIENPLSKLKKLNGIIYTWNDLANQLVGYSKDEEQVGLIAQEVHNILPQVTKIAPFDSDNRGSSKSGENYLTIQYERLVPLLVESVKELSDKVEKLEEENKRLRNGDS